MDYNSAQYVFDTAAGVPVDALRAHFIVDDIQQKHKEFLIKHGKFPEEYHDDLEAAAKKYGFEFLHPKYVKGPKAVESRPTVH